MKIGLIPAFGGGISTTPEFVTGVARAAERNGFDSLWVGEHVVLPVHQYTEYPGSQGGLAAPSSAPLPDPLEWLSYAAGKTDTLLLGTAILLVTLHHPLTLAKRLATLDSLSAGRVRIGVGIGWNPQEYGALGVPFEARGSRLEEYIAAMRTLWHESERGFEGKFVSFEPVYSSPKPHGPSIPVLIGGDSDAAARRAGRIGDGYFPFERNRERLGELLTIMRTAAEKADRDPSAIEVTVKGSTRPEAVEQFEALGVTRMTVFMSGPDVDSIDELGARCRAAIGSAS